MFTMTGDNMTDIDLVGGEDSEETSDVKPADAAAMGEATRKAPPSEAAAMGAAFSKAMIARSRSPMVATFSKAMAARSRAPQPLNFFPTASELHPNFSASSCAPTCNCRLRLNYIHKVIDADGRARFFFSRPHAPLSSPPIRGVDRVVIGTISLLDDVQPVRADLLRIDYN
jgi:hypothetical protein